MSQFCLYCGYATSMHDFEDDCDGAENRVESLRRMEAMFINGVLGR